MTIIAIECRIVFVVVIEIVLFVNFLPPRSKEGTKCLQWIFFYLCITHFCQRYLSKSSFIKLGEVQRKHRKGRLDFEGNLPKPGSFPFLIAFSRKLCQNY